MVACGLKVTGIDSSPTLISLCRSRMPDQDWIVADMRSPALDRRFDGVLAWDSVFHLDHDHQRRMFDAFARHGARGAVLMFNAGPAHGETVGTYGGDPLYHASLDAAGYAILLDDAGFDIIEHAVEDKDAGGRTVWLARLRPPDRPAIGMPGP